MWTVNQKFALCILIPGDIGNIIYYPPVRQVLTAQFQEFQLAYERFSELF